MNGFVFKKVASFSNPDEILGCSSSSENSNVFGQLGVQLIISSPEPCKLFTGHEMRIVISTIFQQRRGGRGSPKLATVALTNEPAGRVDFVECRAGLATNIPMGVTSFGKTAPVARADRGSGFRLLSIRVQGADNETP